MVMLEVDFLNVLVGTHGQAVATAQTAAFQNLAAISSCHTTSETVHTYASANLRLIRSFRHFFSFSDRIFDR